jgi:spermidine/putrescine transport system substrate-binding protein
MLDGRNSADLSNMMGAGNPNKAALPFIKQEVKSIGAVFPDEATARKLEQLKDMTPQQRRAMNRIWTEIKAKGK